MPLNTTLNSALMPDGSQVTYDGLLNNRFNIVFSALPKVVFFLQGFSLPSITVQEVPVSSPIVDMNEIGEKIEFKPYRLNFLVDSEMKNFKEVYAWMKRMTSQGSNVGETSDATVFFNGIEMIKFIGCWPTQLGGIDIDVTTDQDIYVYSYVTINYDYFNIVGATIDNY